MPENGELTVHATPSKELFISMLTRDISLGSCVLDLVDNSVHSLIAHSGLDVTESMVEGERFPKTNGRIEITYTPKRFMVVDNCGGIPIEEARNEVFLFGHLNQVKSPGLGVYGIGMKRAIFKIGKMITVTSNTTEEEFQVTIDVDKWKKKEDWDLKFDYARKRKHPVGKTIIKIEDLDKAAASQFNVSTFHNAVRDRASVAYSLFLRAGLQLVLNGDVTEPWLPPISFSQKTIKPVRQKMKEDGVDVLIMAGVAPLDDHTPHGWYIFCNGRLVLEADKTSKTGWGTPRMPQFHTKYNHFLGLVFMRCEDVWKLPWTTTKDSINLESRVYQRALDEMSLHTRKILDFLNEWYEKEHDEQGPRREVIGSARTIDPQKLASSANQGFFVLPKADKSEQLTYIQYRRKRRLIDDIKDFLKKSGMSASRVGEYTFDWFYDRNCKK